MCTINELGLPTVEDYKCPNNCKDGRFFDRQLRRFVPCPACRDRRAKEVRGEVTTVSGESVSAMLGLPERFTGTEFSMDAVIPDEYAQHFLTRESLDEVKTALEELLKNATLGIVPARTVCFNLGGKYDANGFTYPYLLRAYKAGLKVAPQVTTMKLQMLRKDFERNMADVDIFRSAATETFGKRYEDFVEADICVVLLDAGSTKRDIEVLRGLVDNRATEHRATVIFTYCLPRGETATLRNLFDENGMDSLRLAKYIEVKYFSRGENGKKRTERNSGGWQTPSGDAIDFTTDTPDLQDDDIL